jgi:hypothetical protein
MVVQIGHFFVLMAGLQAQNVIRDRTPDGAVKEMPESMK